MEVTISIMDGQMAAELKDAIEARLEDLGYDDDQIVKLTENFEDEFDSLCLLDVTFEVEMNDDETEIVSCSVCGG